MILKKLGGLLGFVGIFFSFSQSATAFMAEKAPASYEKYVTDKVINDIREQIQKPVVILTVSRQNTRFASLSQSEIDALDKQWRREREAEDQPLIAPTMNNPLSTYLTQIQAGSLGLYTEMFIMDSKGLNVGQSAITSDMWQGDEAKFQKTYPLGADAVFLDEPEFNDATKTWRVQFNMTLVDEARVPIGAATIELNLTELMRRQQ